MPVKTTKRGTNKSSRKKSGFLSNVLELAGLTFAGRVILVLLAAALLAAANMLISNNDYNLFFRLTGIELVVASILFWIRFLVRKS